MRFKIYIRRFGKLHPMGKLHRGANGLYLLSRNPNTYASYHEDGKYWMRVDGRMVLKKLREPLNAFSGAETVQLSYTFLDDGSPIAVDPTSVRLQPDDIVLDHGGIVGVELILSGKPLKFGALPDRLDSLVFTKRCSPLVTIEAFTLAGTTFSRPRFPRAPKKVYLDPPDRI
jgi:hypothetical protein